MSYCAVKPLPYCHCILLHQAKLFRHLHDTLLPRPKVYAGYFPCTVLSRKLTDDYIAESRSTAHMDDPSLPEAVWVLSRVPNQSLRV